MEHEHSIYQQHDSVIGKLAQRIQAFSAPFLITVMTCVIFLEVLFRYVMSAGFAWSQEVCGLSFLLLVFLCQANTWQEDRHIRMDIFYSNFRPALRAVSNMLSVVCGVILYSSIAWQGIADLQYQFEVHEATSELLWPLWPFSLTIVLSSIVTLLLLLRFSITSILRK